MAAKATVLSEEDIQNICKEYVETETNTEKLGLKYHVGKKRIVAILNERGVERKPRGRQFLKTKFVVSDWRIKKYPPVEGKHWEAVDKEDGFRSKDIENYSGILTSRVTKKYGIEPPLWHVRNKYYMETGNYWWEQWYNVELVDDKPTKKCPYCNWETVDVDNRSGWFGQHLMNAHGMTKKEYLKEHPEDKGYFEYVVKHYNSNLYDDDNEFVTCKVCGQKMCVITASHLATHGMTKMDYIEKYGRDNMVSKNAHNKMSESSIIGNMTNFIPKQSLKEIEISDFIRELGFECRPDREILWGKELDIYIPSAKLALEYNGELWHGEFGGNKYPKYHYEKMVNCEKKGIHLFTVFEDEYKKKSEIVLKRIAHKLGKSLASGKVYGRNCNVQKISKEEANAFLEKNDIDGGVDLKTCIGAYYKDKLVGVMCFDKKTYNTWSLERVATDLDLLCSGVCGKMFSFFLKNYACKSVEVLGDRRWAFDSRKNLFTKLGFEYVQYVDPSYKFYHRHGYDYKTMSQSAFRKRKDFKELIKKMSEDSAIKALDYDRVWDCGYIKYIYKS